MNLFEKIINRKTSISVIGLGYVGLPVAVAFAKKIKVIGFDINSDKIANYKAGIDPTNEVGNREIKKTSLQFSNSETDLQNALFHIVAVPTPVRKDRTPNLEPIKSACKIVGRNLRKGSIVVFESTVYPGVTEEICIPILEKESGMVYLEDFKVGYSPERINPGDKENRLETIIKIVSASDEESLDTITKVYELVVKAGVYQAKSIKVAEAAKVIENSQRDINIAFMNELSIIFNKMGIDTKSVLEAARTKWNFLNFYPGLVGGHCIGVDPYYLTYRAEQFGYHSQIILSGRRINDEMGKYVAENLVKYLIKADVNIRDSKIVILGFTFKENCPDTRNTRVIDIVSELREFGVEPIVVDPEADRHSTEKEYGIQLVSLEDIYDIDAVVIAVAHDQFKNLELDKLSKKFRSGSSKVLFDVKGMLDKNESESLGFLYWRL